MTEILVLGDGTELYGYAEYQSEKLYLYVHGKTLQEIEELLKNQENLKRIISRRNDGTHTYEGFIQVKEILEVSDQFVTATLEYTT